MYNDIYFQRGFDIVKVSIYTLGCKVNQYESRIMEQDFITYGYEIVPFADKSDVVVIHTCAVTEESARKSRQIMRRAKKLNPNAVIVVVGCLVQTSCSDIFPQADVLVGNRQKRELPAFVGQFLQTGIRVEAVHSIHNVAFEPMCLTHDEHTRAMVKVQDGCNNFCSYCIIPYARGRIRSKKIEEAVMEITELVQNGYKEIVLTGIHLDSYGKDIGTYTLCDLILKVNEIPGIERIRLSSLEPVFITQENLSIIAVADKLCHHFHLSLQSGCTKTLRNMNRRYTAELYAQSVQRLRQIYADVSLTTDVIVGFPGESDRDFEDSLQFVKNIGFSKVHVFPFSPRRGTKAYEMGGQIATEVKKERCARMLQVSYESEQAFLQNLYGKTLDVLFEQERAGMYAGYTGNYAQVRVNSAVDIRNKIIPVRITGVMEDYCIGDLQNS